MDEERSGTVFLTHPLLLARGVAHGFGVRGTPEPAGLQRPRQVHGREVWVLTAPIAETPEADAVVSALPAIPVGVVTADCVPILLIAGEGECVAAIHAGWRGLARGVVASAVAALRAEASAEAPLTAAIGPHIAACCYEVDAPVLDALCAGAIAVPVAAQRPARAERWWLHLGAVARAALEGAGVAAGAIGDFPGLCTRCDAERFYSYRREGPQAGRLVHFICARSGGA